MESDFSVGECRSSNVKTLHYEGPEGSLATGTAWSLLQKATEMPRL